MNIGIIILIVGLIIICGIISVYNSLISLKNAVKNAWAQIDTQLKRRYDLIPNLIETVKGYMDHEKSTFELVIKARSEALTIKSDDINGQIMAQDKLQSSLKNLFALSENYPELKANQNFLALQEELSSTENKISYARMAYNDAVMLYSNAKEQFPTNIIAGMFNFQNFNFFEASDSEKENVRVKF